MSDKEAMELRAKLEQHYHQPVAPVSEYCDAFRTWATAADEYLRARGLNPEQVRLAIEKSNLLWRLIYGKQKLRKKKCPVHKGKWSGCVFPSKVQCACVDSSNVTGWLPEPDDENADRKPKKTRIPK